MTSRTQTFYRLIVEIRGAFQDLGALATTLHDGRNVNASMRAVLERLDEHGPQTVPAIARAKNVSRQHIQTIVDMLKADRLAETKHNPAHKTSPLVAMTRKGRSVFDDIRRDERKLMAALSRQFDVTRVADATETLSRLRAAISNTSIEGSKK